jgi:type VI secretion system protein VasD
MAFLRINLFANHKANKKKWMAILVVSTLLAGCSAADLASVAIRATGINQPEIPESQKPPRNIRIAFHASTELNTDENGRPLALVTKIFKLKQNSTFENAPYNAFLSPEEEKVALGADLLEVKEVVLVPGQVYEIEEKVSREAYHIGVAALFLSPYGRHWRTTFAPKDVEENGVTIHFYSCGLAVASAEKKEKAINALLSKVDCYQ